MYWKFYSKLISYLGTDGEKNDELLLSKIFNLIQLLVSVMSHSSQTFTEHLKN